MPEINALTFRHLLAGHSTAEVKCLIKGTVVRRLRVEGDRVEVDALIVKVWVGLDDRIDFTPWVFDRGNLNFACNVVPAGQKAKLCTEADIIAYPDGTTASIVCRRQE